PVAVFRPSAGDNVKESLLNRFCDGATSAIADGASVNLADRRYFNRSAGQERFIGAEQFVEFQRADFDFIPQVARNLNRRRARDPQQDRRVLVIGQYAPAFNEEDVLDRALGQIAVYIKQNGLVVTARRRFPHSQDRIQIIPRGLRSGRDHARMEFFVRRDGDSHPSGEFLRAEIVWPFPGEDVDAHRTDGANPQAATVKIDCWADVTTFEFISANRFADRFVQLLPRVLDIELINRRRGVEPIHVLLQPEDGRAVSRLVTANAFKDAR